MNAYIDDIVVRDSKGEEAILYPSTKQEAVEGLMERLANVEKPDITTTTETTMPNSHDGRLLVNEIGGVCEQDSTSGKNLANLECITVSGDYMTLVRAGNLSAIKAGKQYTISVYLTASTKTSAYWNMGSGIFEHSVFDVNAGTNRYSYTFVATADGDSSNNVPLLSKSGAGDGISITAFNAQIEESSMSEYEPYTGGIPAPNPDYPQEIKKSVVSEIKTHGKNKLINTLTSQTANGLTVTVHEDKSVSVKGTSTDVTVFIINSFLFKANKPYILNGSPKNGSNLTYQLDLHNIGAIAYADTGNGVRVLVEEDTIYNVRIRVYKGVTIDATFYPMIREASVEDDTYEPYTESVVTLSQPIELYGIGDVQDVIDVERGVVIRNVGKLNLDDLTWSYNADGVSRLWVSNSFRSGKRNTALMCETIVYQVCGYDKDTNGTSINAPHNIWARNGSTTVAPSGKALYELATPIEEVLPIADQIALNSLQTFDGITYLEFDAEVQPTFKGEYGTSKVGGYTLEGMLAGRNGELYGKDFADRITALETTVVNNI